MTGQEQPRRLAGALVALVVACSPTPPTPDAPEGTDAVNLDVSATGPDVQPVCPDAPSLPIHFGATDPTRLPLNGGQVLAVARVEVAAACSGVIVAPRWALTAAHCVLGPIVGDVLVGLDPEHPDVTLPVRGVHAHPSLDVALLELTGDARVALPALEPVPIVPFPLPPVVGALAEAAGYGEREDGRSGARRFFSSPIIEVLGEEIVIDGMGEAGACFGDSGGPLFVLGAGGVRVAGVLSVGDPSCVGRSRFARLDVIRPWLESLLGAVPPDDPACGDVDALGTCRGATAVRCEAGALRFETCGLGLECRSGDTPAGCASSCP